MIINNQAVYQGKPVSLAPPITEEYILAQFHQVFLHNKVNQVEASKVSLFGGSLSQAPKESLSDYLLRFKAKVWDANLVLEDNPVQMISLVYHGLQPYLKQHGFNSRKTNAMFESFTLYEEFLTEKESIVLRMKDFQGPSTGMPLRVAPVRARGPHYEDRAIEPQYEDDYGTDLDFDKEEEDYYTTGMVNALGSRQPARQKRTPSIPQQVTIPGPSGSKAIVVRKRDVAFFLTFANDSADWPSNGTPFSGPLKDNTVPGSRPSHKDQVHQLMKFLRPTIQDSTVFGIYDTAKAHNREWVWCILHGSEHHHTHLCPCLLKAFPARTKAYNREKAEYKKAVNVVKRQEGFYSGDDEE
jgi:hypothetical protein